VASFSRQDASPPAERFLRVHRTNVPQDASRVFHRRANRVELQIVRRFVARDERSRGARPVRRNSEKRRMAKNRQNDALQTLHMRSCARYPYEAAPLLESALSQVLSLQVSVFRAVALVLAYRYGYIRHTSRSTNGYFAETTSRRFL